MPQRSPADASATNGSETRQRQCRYGPMRYRADDAYIGAALDRYGEFSPAEAALLSSLLRPGDVAVDAGANIGCFTVPMAQRVGPQGRIHAFEPLPAAFELLHGNLALNGLGNVVAHRAALGSQACRRAIALPEGPGPANYGAAVVVPEGAGEAVEVTTIDALELPDCRLIKADVQGMEREVLLGAAGTIARHRPVLYLENDQRERSRALLQSVFDLGYRTYWHLPPIAEPGNFGGVPVDHLAEIVSANIVCMPDGGAAPGTGFVELTSVDDWWQGSGEGRVRTDTSDLLWMAQRQFGRARFDEARTLLDALLEIEPQRAELWFLLAECHQAAGRDTAAIACLRRFLVEHREDPEAHSMLAHLYADRKRFGDAVEAMACAQQCDPSDASLCHGLAVMLRRQGRRQEALAQLDEALARAPHFDGARFERAMILLELGRLAEAWADYDLRRLFDPGYAAPSGPAAWQGGAFGGKRLLVTGEGGYGDTIWAARFLPAVRALGGEVFLQVRPALRELLAGLEGVDGWVDADAGAAEFDLHCPILSLPARLGVGDAAAFPPARLSPRRGERPRWERLLARAAGRLRVGVLWSGSETYPNNHHRAASLEDFLPLLELPAVQLFSLQKGPPQAVLRGAGLGSLIIETDDFDFAETAALVEALDLVVMTDTAVAHLAASLGRPVWVLLDSAPFWLYGMDGETCPWYPSMRLFRQSAAGDWRGVIQRVAVALAEAAPALRPADAGSAPGDGMA